MHPFLALLESSEPYQLPWSDLVLDYAGFLASFAMFGALGFYFVVLRGMRVNSTTHASGGSRSDVSDTTSDAAHETAAVSASAEWAGARVGLIGAILFLVDLIASIAANAAEKNLSFADAVQHGGANLIAPLVFGVLLIVVFALAMRRVHGAWIVALIVGLALALRSVVTLKWTALVNPVHELAASVWLGTLLVLIIAGLPAILRSRLSSERRGALVADFVGRFSPLALCAAGVLGVTGVTTAWRHLKFVAALWTTSYGYALDIKLCVVAIVIGLGAWNWRRMSPRLGTESAAYQLRRSARTELAFGAVVLAITAVLVSLPSPKLPH